MNKYISRLLLFFISTFILIKNVNAECSYQERKDLLNEAKSVNVSYEPIENNGTYSFKFNVVGLTENIFVKYYNLNDGIENYIYYNDTDGGLYSFADNNSSLIYTYNFIIYSANENCAGYEIYSKKIKKPLYNVYSENINCKNESYENFKYCTKFLETDYKLTKEKFYESLISYNATLANTETAIEEESFVKKNLGIFIAIPLVVLVIISIIIIRKKRSKL